MSRKKAKITIKNDQKKEQLTSDIKEIIRAACFKVLEKEGFSDQAEINVTVVDNEEIRRLNSTFRNIDRATDVLSFPLGENGQYDENPENGAKMLGDIVISLEMAVKQADEYQHSLKREVAFLTVHSMLHLLGYDHINSREEEKLMFDRQEQILDIMGIIRT